MRTIALPRTLLRALHVMVLAGVVGLAAVAGAPAGVLVKASALTSSGAKAITEMAPPTPITTVTAAPTIMAVAPAAAAPVVTVPTTIAVPVVTAPTGPPTGGAPVPTSTPAPGAAAPAPVPTPARAPAPAAVPLAPVVVPAAAPAAPAPAGDGVSATAARAVFGATNTFRGQNGVPALVWNAALQRSAHQHNLAMAAANQMSHQLPGERSFDTRISDQGVPWLSVGENVGYNTDRTVAGALALHAMMINEVAPNDDHKVNKLDPKFTTLGVDVYLDPTTGTLWLTEDYAQI